MALIIAGERSGVGKTTVTLALLSFLSRPGNRVQSFKVGPDYIDPMFHTAVTGRPCRNLDPVLTSEDYVQACFARHRQGADYALVEGVMGLFDGIQKENRGEVSHDFASTAHIARLLNIPVLLVIDCSRLSGSVAAIAQGYRSFDARVKLAGVVLNRVGSDRHLELLENALEPLHLPILGILRRQEPIALPDRHLGLVPAEEIDHLQPILEKLAELGKNCFDWPKLLPLLQGKSQPLHFPSQNPQSKIPNPKSKIALALARDRAFNFYYPDNLDLLEQLGAELVPWSPLEDEKLPQGIQGLYFGGGFPEVFAQQLGENQPVRAAVRSAIQSGMPTYAECGGLMYLCTQIIDFAGKSWPMVGILPTNAVMSPQLTLGYRQATALADSLLWQTGETVWGHEFHRSQLAATASQPLWSLRGSQFQSPTVAEGWYLPQLHASYLHLHFGNYQTYLERFLQHCLKSEGKVFDGDT